MAQKFLTGIHVSGSTQLDFMPTHESEGILRLGRYDVNTSRYHDIKSYVSSTTASNYLKFSLHNGTTNTVADVLTLKGDLSAVFAGALSGITTLSSTYAAIQSNINSSGTGGLTVHGNRLGFDQSGTRSWTMYASGGNLNINSGDSNGNLAVQMDATFAGQVTVSGGSKLGGGSLQVTSDSTYLSNYSYTFRDAVGINNPNSTSAATSSTTVMAIGAKSGGTVNTSLITTGAVGIGAASPDAPLSVHGATGLGVGASGIRVHRPDSFGQFAFMDYGQSTGTAYFGSSYTGGTAAQYGVIAFRQLSNGGTPTNSLTLGADKNATFAGNVGIGVAPSTSLHVYQNDTNANEVMFENDGTGDAGLTLRSDDNVDGSTFAFINFDANSSTNGNTRYARIRAYIEDNTQDTQDGKLLFTI